MQKNQIFSMLHNYVAAVEDIPKLERYGLVNARMPNEPKSP